MSTNTVNSTQQQDQVSRSNSAQMRRHSADQKAAQGASAFADLLQQATEPTESTEADSADLLTDMPDTQAAAGAPADPAEWLALTQAYAAPRAAEPAATDTAATATPTADDDTGPVADPLVSTAPTDDEPVPELDAEARAEAAPASPRRAPGKAAAGAATLAAASLGAPASRGDTAGITPITTAAGAALASATAPAMPGAAAVLAARAQAPAQATASGPVLSESAVGDDAAPLPLGLERAPTAAAARGDAGAPQTDVQAGGDGPSANERTHEADTPQPDTPPWGEQWGEAMEDAGHQISYWLGRGVKQAQIQVEAGLGRPLEVAVSLDKGQAVLHFQTDSASARAAIESGAADVLRDALARDGIGLAGLSVGGQDRQGQPGGEARAGRRAWEQPGADGAPAPEATAIATRPSNRVLDLYA